MQLLIILALLLYGGNNDTQKLLSEVAPVLESFGGDEIKEALKNAEELSSVLSAVNAFTPPMKEPKQEHTVGVTPNNGDISFPLAPINNIADREITYSLSKYISQN